MALCREIRVLTFAVDTDTANLLKKKGRYLELVRATRKFPPSGWAFCDGQLLPINQNGQLFSLIGTNYGGDAMDHGFSLMVFPLGPEQRRA